MLQFILNHDKIILMIKNKLTVCTLAAIAIMSCSQPEEKANTDIKNAAIESPEDIVKHGEYLVQIMGCNDCHSPKRMGAKGPEIIPELMLSGYPSDRPVASFDNKLLKTGFSVFYPDLTGAAGPWGISFAGNLTPDETGIGSWTEQQFGKAIREGKFKGIDGTRPLLPPMPWMNYTKLSDNDVKSIFAYLKSIKPVRNIVPMAVPPDSIK